MERRDPIAAGLVAGAVAGPLFWTTAMVEGILRPDYQPIRHPISSLSFGPRGGVQVANFLLAGTLYAGFAMALSRTTEEVSRSRAIPIMVGGAASGLVLSGLLTADPVSGYPPGTPDKAVPTVVGTLHNLAGVPLMVGMSGAALVEARRSARRRQRIWAAYSAASGLLTPSVFLLAAAGFAQQPKLVARAGLRQRIAVGIALGWVTAFATRQRGSGR